VLALVGLAAAAGGHLKRSCGASLFAVPFIALAKRIHMVRVVAACARQRGGLGQPTGAASAVVAAIVMRRSDDEVEACS